MHILKKKKSKKRFGIICCGLLLSLLILIALDLAKLIFPNRLLLSADYCKGADISHYQGNADMKVLSDQGITFVYIKATEGSSHVDPCYSENSQNAAENNMLYGAYHFFSFDSDASTQAALFLETAGAQKGCLIPAVDVEYYGDKRKNPPDAQALRSSLQEYLDLLESACGRKPVIYTTLPFYNKYLKGYFTEYPLWIRSVYFPAALSTGEDWTFWQYDDHTILEGYDGEEKYIDLNVFHGDIENLNDWIL